MECIASLQLVRMPLWPGYIRRLLNFLNPAFLDLHVTFSAAHLKKPETSFLCEKISNHIIIEFKHAVIYLRSLIPIAVQQQFGRDVNKEKVKLCFKVRFS